jgi:type IV pilus assembly protein PilX
LFFVLIVLLLVSIMAALSLRTGMLQERMVSGLRDRAVSLQNAEAALRDAERGIEQATFGTEGIGVDCSAIAGGSSPACAPHPQGAAAEHSGMPWVATVDIQAGSTSAGVPQYAVQYMGRRESDVVLGLGDEANYGVGNGRVEAEYYRVVARGTDPATSPDRATVVLQTTVVRE